MSSFYPCEICRAACLAGPYCEACKGTGVSAAMDDEPPLPEPDPSDAEPPEYPPPESLVYPFKDNLPF